MKRLVLFAAVVAVTAALTGNASADMMWYELTGSCACMADSANDYHLVIDADSIDNIAIVNDPCPTCTDVEIVVNGEGTGLIEIDINWIGDYVIAGAGLEMVFSTNTSVNHAEGYWSLNGEFASSSYVEFEWLPYSPLPSVTGYGLIALVIVTALTGIWTQRRRRFVSAQNP